MKEEGSQVGVWSVGEGDCRMDLKDRSCVLCLGKEFKVLYRERTSKK